eukprot:scaffold119249_cov30-Tisochrysis_lutea.AAC.1
MVSTSNVASLFPPSQPTFISGGHWGPRVPLTPSRTPPRLGPYNQSQPLPSGSLESSRGWALINLAQNPSGRGARGALPRPHWACPRADSPLLRVGGVRPRARENQFPAFSPAGMHPPKVR